jgi:hypothetical protein
MRIARVRSSLSVRPRVALERDGALYDVATLEESFGRSVPVIGEPSDFGTRVVAMACAGLGELDARLVRGDRPTRARLAQAEVVELAPCDTERAAFVQVDLRAKLPGGAPVVRLGHARALEGQAAFVDLPAFETRPAAELWLGALLGDELRSATPREAKQAVLGLSVVLAWLGLDLEDSMRATQLGSSLGWSTQLGPRLIAGAELGRLRELSGSLRIGGQSHDLGAFGELGTSIEEAVAAASELVHLGAGDVVALGPWPRSGTVALDLRLGMHTQVEVEVRGVGCLRGVPVQRTSGVH